MVAGQKIEDDERETPPPFGRHRKGGGGGQGADSHFYELNSLTGRGCKTAMSLKAVFCRCREPGRTNERRKAASKTGLEGWNTEIGNWPGQKEPCVLPTDPAGGSDERRLEGESPRAAEPLDES